MVSAETGVTLATRRWTGEYFGMGSCRHDRVSISSQSVAFQVFRLLRFIMVGRPTLNFGHEETLAPDTDAEGKLTCKINVEGLAGDTDVGVLR